MYSCSSQEEATQKRIEKIIIREFPNKLKSPDSYISVSFTQYDSIFPDFDDAWQNQHILSEYKHTKFAVGDYQDVVRYPDLYMYDYVRECKDSLRCYQNKLDSLVARINIWREKYIPEFDGFQVYHTYKAKNPFGVELQSTELIHIYKDFSGIEIE